MFGRGHPKDLGHKAAPTEDSDLCPTVEKIAKTVVSLCDVESAVKSHNIKLHALCC